LKIIKLDAIDSTNTFLKDLVKTSNVENYTIVVTKNQTKGRGQHHSNWISEPNKNLTFSVLINDLKIEFQNQKYLNFAISIAIYTVLKSKEIPNLSIKWANDIMSANQKLCGILIENSLKNDIIHQTIIGIGLNVNQTKFENSLNKATSMKIVSGKNYDLESLLIDIIKELKNQIELIKNNEFKTLENNYLKNLYKKDKVAVFRNKENETFNGIIRGISKEGLLKVELENESIKEYGIKEITFL